MRIGLDAMGGDCAPVEEVQGALAARRFLSEGDRVVLIGDETAVRRELAKGSGPANHVEVRHAEQVIGMDEAPVEALRNKPNSSIAVLMRMQAAGELDAGISAGNTGACVAAAQMRLRRLPGVRRPGIAVVMPTHYGPVALCDVGANVNCRPQHLHQYGLMASVYVKEVCKVENPRIAILSVGEEDVKGNELVKSARHLLEADRNARYVGNVEGRDLFRGVCDVVVCDGFVGNVVLKLMEGMAVSLAKGLLAELLEAMPQQAEGIQRAARTMAGKYDFNEYGGAPLLGVGGIFIICHGASNACGIMNAIRVAREFSRLRVNEQITQALSHVQEAADA